MKFVILLFVFFITIAQAISREPFRNKKENKKLHTGSKGKQSNETSTYMRKSFNLFLKKIGRYKKRHKRRSLKRIAHNKYNKKKSKKIDKKKHRNLKIYHKHKTWWKKNHHKRWQTQYRKMPVGGAGGGSSSVIAPSQGVGIANPQIVVNNLGTPAAQPYADAKATPAYKEADAAPKLIITRIKIRTPSLFIQLALVGYLKFQYLYRDNILRH